MQGEQPRPSGPASVVCNLDFFTIIIDISASKTDNIVIPFIEYKNKQFTSNKIV